MLNGRANIVIINQMKLNNMTTRYFAVVYNLLTPANKFSNHYRTLTHFLIVISTAK